MHTSLWLKHPSEVLFKKQGLCGRGMALVHVVLNYWEKVDDAFSLKCPAKIKGAVWFQWKAKLCHKCFFGCHWSSRVRLCESLSQSWEWITIREKEKSQYIGWNFPPIFFIFIFFVFIKAAATWVSLPTHCCTIPHHCMGYCIPGREGKGTSENLAATCEPVGLHSPQPVGRCVMS